MGLTNISLYIYILRVKNFGMVNNKNKLMSCIKTGFSKIYNPSEFGASLHGWQQTFGCANIFIGFRFYAFN
jgi:hypothetical protein